MPRSADPDPGPDDAEPDASGARPPPPKHRPARKTRKGLKAWDAPPNAGDDERLPGEQEELDAADEEEEEPPRKGLFGRPKEKVYFRARDAWWFEPLVALMVVVVILAGLYAYTSNWPPIYVVESMSMQHGTQDQVGLINTGDLVLAQQIPNASIQPYLIAMERGYMTYGEYGDVLLYHPNGETGVAPIIHRSLLFLVYYPGNDTYSAPDLTGLTCGPGTVFDYTLSGPTSRNGCGTTDLSRADTLTLHGIGWQSTNVQVSMNSGVLGTHSGFLTMGDNNFEPGNYGQGICDQMGGISSLVEPGWVVGVARGMIPWFGALKLALDGNDTEVPSESWDYLGLTVVGIIVAGLVVHGVLRSRGREDERRIEEEQQEEDEREAKEGSGSKGGGSGGFGWFRRRPPPEEEPEAGGPASSGGKTKAAAGPNEEEEL
jgi:signal peptidase I